MDTDFNCEMHQHYVYVQIRPGFRITLESTSHLWDELQTFCESQCCRTVLCEGVNPMREMTPQDLFESACVAAERLLGLHVAFHWEGYRADDLTDIFICVAHNKGVNFGFFESRTEALEWLRLKG